MSKARKAYPSEIQERFIVRFPDGMRDRIRDQAEKNGRSMNAEIIHRLALTMEYDKNFIGDDVPSNRASGWAEHLSNPKNRHELESLLAVVQEILSKANQK